MYSVAQEKKMTEKDKNHWKWRLMKALEKLLAEKTYP